MSLPRYTPLELSMQVNFVRHWLMQTEQKYFQKLPNGKVISQATVSIDYRPGPIYKHPSLNLHCPVPNFHYVLTKTAQIKFSIILMTKFFLTNPAKTGTLCMSLRVFWVLLSTAEITLNRFVRFADGSNSPFLKWPEYSGFYELRKEWAGFEA